MVAVGSQDQVLARDSRQQRDHMKIATWNVNGMRAREAQLLAWLADERPDVVCLQEIKATAEQIPPMLAQVAGYWCRWHCERRVSGVALLVREGLCAERPAVAARADFDFETRIVTATPASRSPRSTCRTAARTWPRSSGSWRRWSASPGAAGARASRSSSAAT